jgi:hypothetical protein
MQHLANNMGSDGSTPPPSPKKDKNSDVQMGGTTPPSTPKKSSVNDIQMGGTTPPGSPSQKKGKQRAATPPPAHTVPHDEAISHVVGAMDKSTKGAVKFDEKSFRQNYKQKLDAGIQR